MNTTPDTIPNAKSGQIIDLMIKLNILGGQCDKEGLAYALDVKQGTVTAPIRAALLLGLIEDKDSIITVTDEGNKFVIAGEQNRRSIFGHVLSTIEPFATIVRALTQSDNCLTESEIMNYIKARLPAARNWKDSTSKEMFRTVRNWCEYGMLLVWDEKIGAFRGDELV